MKQASGVFVVEIMKRTIEFLWFCFPDPGKQSYFKNFRLEGFMVLPSGLACFETGLI